jgi:hypothetical protein
MQEHSALIRRSANRFTLVELDAVERVIRTKRLAAASTREIAREGGCADLLRKLAGGAASGSYRRPS